MPHRTSWLCCHDSVRAFARDNNSSVERLTPLDPKRWRGILIVCIFTAVFLLLSAVPAFASDSPRIPQKEFVDSFLTTVRENTYWVENYKFGHWDCTNQSAVLYTVLTLFGIETKIVTGRFKGYYDWHAMLEVTLDSKKYRLEPIYLTFYEDGELERLSWREWSKCTLEEANWIYPNEFHVPLFKKKGDGFLWCQELQ